MDDQKDNSRLLWMLGLALTLPMILLSGPAAGFLIGRLLVKQFHWPSELSAVLMAVGLLGSGLQSFQLIKKMNRSQQNRDQK